MAGTSNIVVVAPYGAHTKEARFLPISYVLCVSNDLLFGAQTYRAWVDLLPRFH